MSFLAVMILDQLAVAKPIQLFFEQIMSLEIEHSCPQSKKAHFHIAKFQYHTLNTIPELFPETFTPEGLRTPKILQQKRRHRNMAYHYAAHTAEGVSSLDAESILESAKKLYITAQCIRMGEHIFKKSKAYKIPYLPIYGHFNEILEFHLINKSEAKQPGLSRIRKSKVKVIEQQSSLSLLPKVVPPNNYQLYVIHHCQSSQKEGETPMKWENFIEKYHFVQEFYGEQSKQRIYYSLILNYEEQSDGMLGFLNPYNKLYDNFIAEYLSESEGELQNVSKMQGYLMLAKDRVDKKLKELCDPSFQQTHKRWLKLPSEYYKQFTVLKKHATSYYNSIHDTPKHPEHLINNLICRYMHANQYSYNQSLESILEYFKWEKEMSASYNLNMFAHLHKLDFFTYLGQDFEGRAVVLNRASHLKVDQIKDIEQYCIYYIYYLEIWLQKKLKGYADQYTIIADVQGLGSDNFKLSITKRNLGDCLRYCPQRQYKLIAVNVGVFASFVWGVLKPLLPKRTISKLSVAGSNKNEIVDILTKQMDITVVPEYLGGKNTHIFSDDFEQEFETKGFSNQNQQN